MDSKLDQWLRIKTELVRIDERKKERMAELKAVEAILTERYLSNGEKVTKEGYVLQVVNRQVSERRLKKSEKISMMASSLVKILKNPPNDKELAVKDILEAGKPDKVEMPVLTVKKVKAKE